MIEKAFEEEKKKKKKMAARLGMGFALVALFRTKTEEFSQLTYLVNDLNSRPCREVAEPYLIELARKPQVRTCCILS